MQDDEVLDCGGGTSWQVAMTVTDGKTEETRPAIAKLFLSKKFLMAVAATILVAGGGIGAYVCRGAKPDKAMAAAAPPVVTVTTSRAAYQPVEDTLVATGSVSAWDPLSVGAEIGGLRIKTVEVEEGDTVKKGQVLARLNCAVLEAQLKQAQARLRSGKASLLKAIQPNRAEEILALKALYAHALSNIAQEEAQLKQSKVNVANAELNHNRYVELARMGAASNQDAEARQVIYENALEQVKSSEAKLNAARSMADQAREKLRAAERGGRAEDVDMSRAGLAEMEGQVQQLTEQIEQTTIKAPDDGVVARRDAHLGDISDAGKPLFHIIRLNKLELRAQVSDLDLPKFKVGQVAKVSATEFGGAAVEGTVRLVSPQVDAMTRQGTVRIALPANSGLRPGMFVRAQINLGDRSALVVPVGSLVTSHGESSIFTLNGTRAAIKHVKVGVQTDKYVEVREGISEGDVVIDKGARFLNDKDVVQVAKQ